MVSSRNREYITVQLLQTQRMLAMVGDHPIMSFSLKQKEQQLLEELAHIHPHSKEAKVVLMFDGNPVKGSMGIDAAFIGKVTVPFQNMITAEFAHRTDGKVGKRGQLNKQNESRLFLTALPRGSFGIELSKLESNDLFEENQMSEALSHITKLIASSSKSDEDFADELDDTEPRIVMYLKEFFKVISDDKAGVTIASGNTRCELSSLEVKSAYERVSGTITSEQTQTISGVLKGILLESWKFDFVSETGVAITGKVDKSLTEETLVGFMSDYFNKPCRAILKKENITFKNGSIKESYTLANIEDSIIKLT